MIGYVGERARKKRRNLIILIILIIIAILGYYFLPFTKTDEILPSETLLPTEKEINYLNLNSTIEELELEIFNGEKKILFRNNQIKEMKNKIDLLTLENNKLLKNEELFVDIKNKNVEKDKNLKKLKDQANQLQKEKNNLIEELNTINDENLDLKNKNKKIFSEKFKLDKILDDYINKIEKLESTIEEQELIIQILKDTSPHG